MIHNTYTPALGALGDGYATAGQISQVGGQVATAAVAATAAATTAAIAVPIIGAAVLGVTLMLNSIAKRNAQKSLATRIVNEVEPQLDTNVRAYFEGPRTQSSQQQAIANFWQGWSLVEQGCSDPQLGSAGRRCISERERGGVAPWCPTGTGCDWFTLYLDPIEQDAAVSDSLLANAASELFPNLNITREQADVLPKIAAVILLAVGVSQL